MLTYLPTVAVARPGGRGNQPLHYILTYLQTLALARLVHTQEDEAARLDAALVSQAASVMDMSSLLASAKPGGTDAEQGVLLLPLPNGKVGWLRLHAAVLQSGQCCCCSAPVLHLRCCLGPARMSMLQLAATSTA